MKRPASRKALTPAELEELVSPFGLDEQGAAELVVILEQLKARDVPLLPIVCTVDDAARRAAGFVLEPIRPPTEAESKRLDEIRRKMIDRAMSPDRPRVALTDADRRLLIRDMAAAMLPSFVVVDSPGIAALARVARTLARTVGGSTLRLARGVRADRHQFDIVKRYRSAASALRTSVWTSSEQSEALDRVEKTLPAADLLRAGPRTDPQAATSSLETQLKKRGAAPAERTALARIAAARARRIAK